MYHVMYMYHGTYTYVYVHIHVYMYIYICIFIIMYIYIRANQIHIHVCIMQDTEKVYTQQQCIMQYTWINIHIHLCMYIMYIHNIHTCIL